MLTIKVQMTPEKEEALRNRVAAHGGPLNAYLLPWLNLIADGVAVLTPQLLPPNQAEKRAAQ